MKNNTIFKDNLSGSEYHIAQNLGGAKLWQIDCFRVLVWEMLANL